MSATQVSAQELSFIYTETYGVVAICALLVYDWLLCLGQEIRFIWNWRSRGVTLSSFVYAFSRYTFLIMSILSVATIYPMSDLRCLLFRVSTLIYGLTSTPDHSCKANVWTETAMEILGLISFSTFSALRAYALSNRSIWFAAIIILLALPPVAMWIVLSFYQAPENLPSPFNCSPSSSVAPILSTIAYFLTRGSQLLAELLVVGITWWYTYQSYRLQKGINLGKTISSLLFYNGSIYFLFLTILYIVSASTHTAADISSAALVLDGIVDPITSILTCRFMLSLRQFDSTISSTAYSGLGPQLREHMASTMLQFGAQPSDSLPALVASFAHPVHFDSTISEMDPDAIVDSGSEGRELAMAVEPTAIETPSAQSPAQDPVYSLEPSV